jgi:hypothetical protein
MIQFSPEANCIKFIQHSFMEAFTDTVSLKMPGFGFAMLYIVIAKIKLVIRGFHLSAVFHKTAAASNLLTCRLYLHHSFFGLIPANLSLFRASLLLVVITSPVICGF